MLHGEEHFRAKGDPAFCRTEHMTFTNADGEAVRQRREEDDHTPAAVSKPRAFFASSTMRLVTSSGVTSGYS